MFYVVHQTSNNVIQRSFLFVVMLVVTPAIAAVAREGVILEAVPADSMKTNAGESDLTEISGVNIVAYFFADFAECIYLGQITAELLRRFLVLCLYTAYRRPLFWNVC
jgi:hypothetical protein